MKHKIDAPPDSHIEFLFNKKDQKIIDSINDRKSAPNFNKSSGLRFIIGFIVGIIAFFICGFFC